jgi:hypothetical protein
VAKPKVTYLEKYRPGEMTISSREKLPERLAYMRPGYRVESMELRAAGKLNDGREFQDLRIYTEKETTHESDR